MDSDFERAKPVTSSSITFASIVAVEFPIAVACSVVFENVGRTGILLRYPGDVGMVLVAGVNALRLGPNESITLCRETVQILILEQSKVVYSSDGPDEATMKVTCILTQAHAGVSVG
jgi:hypothetical protein